MSIIGFSIHEVITIVSWRKNSIIFPCGASLLLVFLMKCLPKCPDIYCIRNIHIQNNSGIFDNLFFFFFFRYMPAYSIIFSVIKACSRILRHQGTFRLIQAQSAPCVTLTYLQPCHILSPGIFGTGVLFKTLWTLTRHIQNTAISGHYSVIFRTLCNACMCRNLAYSKYWSIQNP